MTAHYRFREITPALLSAVKEMPVVVLTGMRQSGKSTLLQREPSLRKRRYVSLDDFAVLEMAEKDPESLISGDGPLTIDEAQKAPQLLQVIKRSVDKKRKPGRFLLSGSANFALLKNVSESLAGRALYMELSPMNRREISGTVGEESSLFHFIRANRWPERKIAAPIGAGEILRGGMPSVSLKEVKHPGLWFRGYEQTYLERDMRNISQVEDLIPFRNLLRLAAMRTGQVLNCSELGRDAKLNSSTVARHLSLFETSFLIARLSPYFLNQASRLIKSPKLYLSDSGLAGYFAGIEEPNKLGGDPFSGPLLETYVYQNLISLLRSRQTGGRLCFWHVQGRHEVDFIMEIGRKTYAIEIKNGSRWKGKDLTGLRTFLGSTPACQAGILAYNGAGGEAVSLGERLWAVPLGLLLS